MELYYESVRAKPEDYSTRFVNSFTDLFYLVEQLEERVMANC